MKYASFGSVSSGTMRAEDLIPAFVDVLEDLASENQRYRAHAKLIKEARGLEDYDSEHAHWVLEELEEALQEFAPPYAWFGSHPGDGADFGFWLMDGLNQAVKDNEGIVVSDLAEVPPKYIGEVLNINDHGNATLYYKSARKFHELWAVV